MRVGRREFPERGEPVYRDPRVVYNSHCDDTGVPSSVSLGNGRIFTVFYDACHGCRVCFSLCTP